MRNQIKCLIVLTLALWFGDFRAPLVVAFFDYNKFHPVPFRPDLQEYCPQVKAMRNFNINDMMGTWYVIEYYASSEEAPEYACMKCNFSISTENAYITMNFTYSFKDDPEMDLLYGNITWIVPNVEIPAHWIHAEYIYEGVYNTYVIDTDYREWALIMHCAEKPKSNRYLSAYMLSRTPTVGVNVINFLREKLPRYDIDIEFMFPIDQENCKKIVKNETYFQ
ncbi:apolipoprotein D [Contarinia nasturtii]|uniref:apolipoprotein D n=1 Tax=Contarinia nasturtii TaxID=265458 RepID=UPI0012D43813|nr:apolipoprotein D [Contarinia nasturtii]